MEAWWRVTRWTVGKSVEHGLLGDRPVWGGWRDLGVISGDFPLGVGLVVGGPALPHDGTVSVEETWLGGATDVRGNLVIWRETCYLMPLDNVRY